MRKFSALATALAIVLLGVGMVGAAPLHTAKVGDMLGTLTNGLDSYDLGPSPVCGYSAEVFGYAKPGLDHTLDNASETGLTFGGNLRIIVTYDEVDMNTAVTAYVADISGDIVAVYQFPIDPSHMTLLCQELGQ